MALSTEEKDQIVEKLSAATVLEIADLVKELEGSTDSSLVPLIHRDRDDLAHVV